MLQKIVIYLIMSMFVIIPNLQAAPSTYYLPLLKGITEINIKIILTERFKEETGLSEDRIKNLISLRFRQSGIRITEEALDTFFITVNFAKAYCCATCIEADLMSMARLERNDSFVYSSIWQNSQIMSGGIGKDLGTSSIEVIEYFVDELLNIYLEANPREFIPRTTLQNTKGEL